MVKEHKLDSVINRADFHKDDFSSNLQGTDFFGVWMLLDYTRFAVARLRDYELSQIGVTPEQAAILQILNNRGGKSTIGKISQTWMRRENSVLTLARRMEKSGLVDILKYPGRKEFEVVMTDKGRKMCSRVTRHSIESVFTVLSDADMQKLSVYLRLLLDRACNILSLIEE
jgi:DNA-binding MarR family transcriptional regulator